MCAGSPVGSAHAYLTKCQRPESIVHEHMADREDRVPSVTLDLDDMRLRYDAYHGSTRLPPGSTSTGEPIQHEQAVQGGPRLRKTEMRTKAMSSFQQHDQGLGAPRSNKITHMTPGISGVVRQAQAPIKKPVLGDEDSGEEDEDEDETER